MSCSYQKTGKQVVEIQHENASGTTGVPVNVLAEKAATVRVQSDFQNHTNDDAVTIDITASPDTHAQHADDVFNNVGAASDAQLTIDSSLGSGFTTNPEHLFDTNL